MAGTIKRKCDECKEYIIIEHDNMRGPVLCKGKYYHEGCFCKFCERKASSKRSLPFWQTALDSIEQYKDDAYQMSKYQFAKNDLNEHLLTHYDVIKVPDRFWNIIADLNNGISNKQSCKPVKTELVLATWRWGQRNLDSIARKNRQNKKGPKNDAERINYDLAIILKHVPDYLKYKAKLDAEEAEREQARKTAIKVNYNNIGNCLNTKNEGIGDISDILDEFF